MASLAIPDELLVDIFLRLHTPEDLIRASAACVSFRRLVADRSFLRRFRKIHPPPLLGFLDSGRHLFHPAVPPHPSAPAASAVALAADFSFAFLPAPARDWSVREVRDGRVLLDRPRRHDSVDGFGALFKEMVVCDPLHRQYLLLPPIPDDLAASVVDQLLVERRCLAETFLVPPGNGDEEEEGTSFRVIWMGLFEAKLVAAVFSSGTGKWRAFSSELLLGFLLWSWMDLFMSRHYAHGCFYWVSGSLEKLLVLDIQRMEFSMADHPLCDRHLGDYVAIVEAGQGMIRMFVPKPDTSRLKYNVWRNNAGISTQWQMEERTFSLDSGSLLTGAVGRHLLLYQCGSSSVQTGGFTLDVDTSQVERAHAMLTSRELGNLCQCLKYRKLALGARKELSSQWSFKLQTTCSSSSTKPRRVVLWRGKGGQAHTMLLMSRERGALCRCPKWKKLTLEACKDLPLQWPLELQTPCSSSTVMLRRVVAGRGGGALGLDLWGVQGLVAELERAREETRSQSSSTIASTTTKGVRVG
ncbi:hypothetical protein ACQJBY_012727 [Aegilops geniculata]